MTKRLKTILALFIASIALLSCNNAEIKEENSTDNKVRFTHYASGGTMEEYDIDIIFEESNSTFTAYQVA